MGCDIHGFYEIKEKDEWHRFKKLPDGRQYDVFALLADVRNYINLIPISEPRGLPKDVSCKVERESDGWDCDGHSHSWLDLVDFKTYNWDNTSIDDRISCIDKETGKEHHKASYMGGKKEGDEDERFIYKHLKRRASDIRDNSMITSIIETLENLIDSGYQDARIVFWFDN